MTRNSSGDRIDRAKHVIREHKRFRHTKQQEGIAPRNEKRVHPPYSWSIVLTHVYLAENIQEKQARSYRSPPKLEWRPSSNIRGFSRETLETINGIQKEKELGINFIWTKRRAKASALQQLSMCQDLMQRRSKL